MKVLYHPFIHTMRINMYLKHTQFKHVKWYDKQKLDYRNNYPNTKLESEMF
jgi:hypothetical protein